MDEIEDKRKALKAAINTLGVAYLVSHIKEQMQDGVDKFIQLPVAQKTSKASFNFQARYDVLKNLLDWIDTEIRAV